MLAGMTNPRSRIGLFGKKQDGAIANLRKVKRQIEKRLQHLAAELLHVQAVRESLKGFSFPADTPWQKEFEKKFPERMKQPGITLGK